MANVLSLSDESKAVEREDVARVVASELCESAIDACVIQPASLDTPTQLAMPSPTALNTEVSNSSKVVAQFSSAVAHNVLVLYDHSKAKEPKYSGVAHTHYVALDNVAGLDTLPMAAMPCSLLTHKVICHAEPSTELPPLYKRNLWEHLRLVKQLSFKSIPLNPKRKPLDDLSIDMASMKIGSDIVSSMKKLKIAQDVLLPTTSVPVVPVPQRSACSGHGKENVVGVQSAEVFGCNFPASLQQVSSIQEDSSDHAQL